MPTETSGKVYGRFYGDYLVRKAIDKIDTLDGFSIYTKGATEAQGINVTYTDLNGDEQVRYFPATGPAIITDAEPGSEFTYTTVYRPDATAVDSVESLPAKCSIHLPIRKMNLDGPPIIFTTEIQKKITAGIPGLITLGLIL